MLCSPFKAAAFAAAFFLLRLTIAANPENLPMKALVRFVRWLIFLAFFLFAFWFALKNATPVPVVLGSELRWEQVPLILIILAALAVGLLLGALAAAPSIFRLRQEVARLARAAAQPRPEPAAERAARTARSSGAVAADVQDAA